jgi:hypothetical protein
MLTISSAGRCEHIYLRLPAFSNDKRSVFNKPYKYIYVYLMNIFLSRVSAFEGDTKNLNELYPATSSFVLTRLGLTLKLSEIFGFNRKFKK